MAGNSFGQIFRLTSYGESHGPSVGGIVDGCPAGIKLDLDRIQLALDRRKPGQSSITSPRKEDDKLEILSGLFEGMTTGTPIAFSIKNKDQRSKDYDHLKDLYRPSHADFVYEKKYGIRDHRGGGRSSARETASRVVAGEIARQILELSGMEINAFVSAVGPHSMESIPNDLDSRWENMVRCPDPSIAANMISYIENLRSEGDSTGGVITCLVKGSPAGLGEPVFDKLNAIMAQAMVSINAVKAFETGSGVEASKMKGSEHNDPFVQKEGRLGTSSNFSGGIQGGISNGEDIEMRIHFKPVATLSQKQKTLNTEGEVVELAAKGRHDPCVVPRAVPIVEAMAALVMCDLYLQQQSRRVKSSN